MTKLSIIIPAFNAELTIAKCLQSVCNQTKTDENIEVIVVDNNSTDQTSEIVKSYAEIKYVKEDRQGRSFARNAGVENSKGELIAFLDADVALDPDWLIHMASVFKNPVVGGAQGPVIPSRDDDRKSLNNYRFRAAYESTSGKFNLLYLTVKESPMINTAACMYRRDAFLKASGFDIRLNRHEDIDLSKRVLLSGYSLASIPEAKAYVTFNGAGWGSYFRRSFDDGYTKHAYLTKWNSYQFDSGQIKNESRSRMFFDEVILSFLKCVIHADMFYFYRGTNSLLKSLGRIAALLRPVHLAPAENLCISHKETYIFENDKKIIHFDLQSKIVRKI